MEIHNHFHDKSKNDNLVLWVYLKSSENNNFYKHNYIEVHIDWTKSIFHKLWLANDSGDLSHSFIAIEEDDGHGNRDYYPYRINFIEFKGSVVAISWLPHKNKTYEDGTKSLYCASHKIGYPKTVKQVEDFLFCEYCGIIDREGLYDHYPYELDKKESEDDAK